MAAGMSSNPPGGGATGDGLAQQAAWADEGGAAAVHDDAKAGRIAGQYDVARPREGGWDAREAGAVSRGFEEWQHPNDGPRAGDRPIR